MDRVTIKQQARQLIKGVWIYLFLITAIIGILVGGNSVFNTIFTEKNKSLNNYGGVSEYNENNYEDFFNQFGNGNQSNSDGGSGSANGSSSDHYSNFTGSIKLFGNVANNFSASIFSSFWGIASLLLSPLVIALSGYYVLVIRGRKVQLGDGLSYIFSSTFSNNYGKRLVLYIVENIIIGFMTVLFIVPGIIFGLKYFFAHEIFCENPKMKPTQALKLSSRMTDGAKGELFVLVLSFLGWFLLSVLTCGILFIYTVPYFSTVKALYYQNFKVKLMQEGRLTEFDFVNEDEQKNMFNQQNYQNAQNGFNSTQNYNPNPYQPAGYQEAQNTAYDTSVKDDVDFSEATCTEPLEPQEPDYCQESKPVDPMDSAVDPMESDEPDGPNYL